MGKSSKSSSSQSQKSKSKSGPWGPSQPYLHDFMSMMGQSGGIGLSPDQQYSFSALKNNATHGDPWTQNKANLTNNVWGQNVGQQVDQANTQLNNTLGKYANGSMTDPMSNPYIQENLNVVGRNVYDQINSAFAGAGRDITGNAQGQRALAQGMTEAQLPILMDAYNTGVSREMGSADALYQAGMQAPAQKLALQGQQMQTGGEAGQAALDGLNYSAERTIDLDQMIKGMPYEDLGAIASLLYPVAGLGGTGYQQGTATGSASTSTSLFSDERVKEDIAEVGKLADGQKLYAFKYKGDDATRLGLMAQEVEEITPEAVTEIDGVKAVNYELATQKARQLVGNRG